jgi:hypothetical protein
MRSGFCASADAQEKAGTCQIASVLGAGVRVGQKVHHAEGELQAALVDDHGKVEADYRRFVHKPGGRQRRDCAAELG